MYFVRKIEEWLLYHNIVFNYNNLAHKMSTFVLYLFHVFKGYNHHIRIIHTFLPGQSVVKIRTPGHCTNNQTNKLINYLNLTDLWHFDIFITFLYYFLVTKTMHRVFLHTAFPTFPCHELWVKVGPGFGLGQHRVFAGKVVVGDSNIFGIPEHNQHLSSEAEWWNS